MKLAIMQPYLFPYLGYLQMVNAVDKFVFYDDVNFIKGGWIHRNNLLINKKANLFTVPLIKPSQNSLIKDTFINHDSYETWLQKFYMKIHQNYSKAPYYTSVIVLLREVFGRESTTISDLASISVIETSKFLGLKTIFSFSSVNYQESFGADRADRLIQIANNIGANTYINAPGGKELYSKDYFSSNQVELKFINSKIPEYKQFNNEFISGLSIIDVLMFNSVDEILSQLESYNLE